jgi:heme/copper-type cytochrome/quinol oxidase subunit 1
MKLSNIKEILPALDNVEFQLENGTFVPEHFHVTEVGVITNILLIVAEQLEMKSCQFPIMECQRF